MKLFATLVSVFVAGSAFAATPGGTDSCGLGWQITQKKSFLATTTRGTTNAVVPPTFGMTSGTIGCDQHTFAKRELATVEFVATNFDSILMDMAAGQGESLAALSESFGCVGGSFASEAQRNYGAMVQSASSAELYSNAKALAVAQGCAL